MLLKPSCSELKRSTKKMHEQAPPLSEGMLSAVTGGGHTWTVKVVKDKYTSETRCASLKSWTASVPEESEECHGHHKRRISLVRM